MFNSIKSYYSKLTTPKSQRAISRRHHRTTELRMEPLEQRRLLSVNEIAFDPATSQIQIFGTSGSDTVQVTASSPDLIHVQMDNSEGLLEAEFQRLDVASILFTGSDGDDLFVNETNTRSLIWGDDGDDVLVGGSEADEIHGGNGNDYIRGSDGDDYLRGYAGEDQLYGDGGNDYLKGDLGHDQLFGAGGNDYLTGGPGADVLYGNSGNDQLDGNDGHDRLYGGAGDDRLSGGNGDDYFRGEGGADILDGNFGNDELYGDNGKDQLKGGAGNDLVFGGHDDDYLEGGEGADILRGNAGNDQLSGSNGDDYLKGDLGDDQLFGADGDDYLFGGPGADTLYGNFGNDLLDGSDGNDHLNGGEGDDQLSGGNDDDYLDGGDGMDLLHGDAGDDELLGTQGNDSLYGDSGNDHLFGGDGDDYVSGGDGADHLRGNVGDDQLYGDAGNDYLKGDIGSVRMFGGDGDDELIGGLEDSFLWGGSGDDLLLGGPGNDLLVGHGGNDYIKGVSGNDVMIGGSGQDSLEGASGDDLLIGGSVAYETDAEKLDALQLQWNLNLSYDARVALIEDSSNVVYLDSETTVSDDHVADTLSGGSGLDWYFVTGSMPIYSPIAGDMHHKVTLGGHHGVEVTGILPSLEGFDLIDALDRPQDIHPSESLHTKIPHARDAMRQNEHLALFELVRYDEVTHYAVSDGDWSDPATWHDEIVPTNGARVLVPFGIHVNVNRVIETRLNTVRVDGSLSFDANLNSELRVDTMVVSPVGSFEMGTQQNPIARNVTARLLITNNGPIDRAADPFGLGRGLIVHGAATFYGSSLLEQSAVLGNLAAGAKELTLVEVPTGWKVGDRIVVPGTIGGASQDEVRQILGISGKVITVAPLSYHHATPSSDLKIHVANLTRNAVVESENTAVERRGHVMFMHTRDVNINYAGFYKLGRSNKLEVVNSPVVDSNWVLQPGTGTNPRGRYAVHFHRNGVSNDGNPAIVHGAVVEDNPGWGYVNHSGYVNFSNNVAFNISGAAFVTEAGDEIGSFHENIAINITGTDDRLEARLVEQDFGHQGDGFWLQGPGVSVTDNIVAGSRGNAFVYYSRGLNLTGVPQAFQSANLVDRSIANGADTIDVQFVPIREFSGNVGFASKVGLTIAYNLRFAPHQHQSLIEASTFWNNSCGVELPYSHSLVLRNLTVTHSHDSLAGTGIRSNTETYNVVYENLTVVGYTVGIDVPRKGYAVVTGGYLNNVENIYVASALANERSVLISGDIQFGSLPEATLAGGRQFQVSVRSIYNPNVAPTDTLFYRDTVILNYGSFDKQRMYSVLQLPSAVPFPTAPQGVPSEFVGTTSQQLLDEFGLAIGGELAPPTAAFVPGFIGRIAPPNP